MSDHYIEKCSCGKVIGQCRCASPDKTVRIIPNGCQDCKIRQAIKPIDPQDAIRRLKDRGL